MSDTEAPLPPTELVTENPTEGPNSNLTGSDSDSVTLLTLNEDAFHEILSQFSYDEVARLRLVCKQFNEVCQKILNNGFMAVQRYHNRCLKEMKAKLPRRESERRAHPLARHIDVLTGIETRLSLLSMTYYKYTVLGVFCFIPGKVLDECYRVLREVIVHKNPPKSYELLQELRDISSMAMEHFEEHIVPTMKKHQLLGNAMRNNSPRFMRCLQAVEKTDAFGPVISSTSSSCPLSPPVRPFEMMRSPSGMPVSPKLDPVIQQNRMLINNQRRQISDMKSKLLEYGRKILEQDRLLHEYGRKIIHLENKISSNYSNHVHSEASTNFLNVTRKRSVRVLDVAERKEGEPSSKRKLLMKKPMITFSMSLRTRKS